MIDTDRDLLESPDGSGRPLVRSEILDSWRRSKMSGVDPDHVGPAETRVHPDWRIARVGVPVLESMAELLIGSNTSLLLSAPDGTLLWRWDENSTLQSKLDRSGAVVGTRWSEDAVGTNGLGTALETAKPITIKGSEHYAEALQSFTCAGAPIRHPVTRRVTGVLSVTSFVKDASPLMAPTLLHLARDVEQELYSESSLHEREMLQQFLAERRRLSGAVIAISPEVFIANAAASGLEIDHSTLWRQIEEASGDLVGRELTSGGSLITAWHPVLRKGKLVGAVVVSTGGKAPGVLPERSTVRARASLAEPTWEETSAAVDLAMGEGRLIIRGEAGVGKRTLVRHALHNAVEELDCTLVDELGAAEWLGAARRATAVRGGAVLLSHLEALDERTARSLATILDGVTDPTLRVVATVVASPTHEPHQSILDRFPLDVIEVAPLRKRISDVHARLISKDAVAPQLSRAALDIVLRHPWPGNDRQLAEFRHWFERQGKVIVTADDLPARWRSDGANQRLTTIQIAESEAIAAALREHVGNKAAAAKALGISRSSMYRKMREYRLG
jgi:transcriptional regulator of acetoin/glycerol metabolism